MTELNKYGMEIIESEDQDFEDTDTDLQAELDSKIDRFLSNASENKRTEFRNWISKELHTDTSEETDSQPQKVLKRPFYR